MLMKTNKKLLYIISSSIILVIVIVLIVFLCIRNSDRKHKNTNTGANNTSAVSESSENNISSSVSDSNANTTYEPDNSSSEKEPASSTDVPPQRLPADKPNPPSTTVSPSVTTPPSTENMTITVESFVCNNEKGYTTGLNVPLFVYMYGTQKTISGIQTTYVQDNDTIVLKTSSKIKDISFDSNFMSAVKTDNYHIKVTAKNGNVTPAMSSLLINGRFKYQLGIYESVMYGDDTCLLNVAADYWELSGGKCTSNNYTDKNYSGGISENSITKTGHKAGNIYYDDFLSNKCESLGKLIDLLNQYKSRGYKNINIFPCGNDQVGLQAWN